MLTLVKIKIIVQSFNFITYSSKKLVSGKFSPLRKIDCQNTSPKTGLMLPQKKKIKSELVCTPKNFGAVIRLGKSVSRFEISISEQIACRLDFSEFAWNER